MIVIKPAATAAAKSSTQTPPASPKRGGIWELQSSDRDKATTESDDDSIRHCLFS